MRNVIVAGCARSGTSLVAGVIAGAGYHMGTHLLPRNDANPHGYFEDYRTVLLNERILRPYTALGDMHRWLAVLPVDLDVRAPADLIGSLRATLHRAPWCRKDPRFCYTLPAWEPVLGDPLRVCVFREPSRTANSLLAVPPEHRVALSFDDALRIWEGAYRVVLRRHRERGDWVFVHYDQILDGSALPRLERDLGVRLDAGFADPTLRRSPARGACPPEIGDLYAELCDAAGIPEAGSR
jgi:hypothetical protein